MICKLDSRVNFSDVTAGFRLKLCALVRVLQESAIEHSTIAGYGADAIIESGNGWVLNKLIINIKRYPLYREEIRTETWHRGSKGFKSYRDFAIYAGDELIVTVSSVYLFLDLKEKRIKRAPADANDKYSVVDKEINPENPEKWRPVKDFKAENEISFTTRFSDFDPMNHVNNSSYFDYIETLIASDHKKTEIKSIKIMFNKEIGKDVINVKAGSKEQDGKNLFKIEQGGTLYACGEYF
ncbi:MAG: hypothetical protein GY714_31375 [Desulfobacterales bacterium]|nr:hypothetical protein [Desulfobacterales bacterium]MCP4159421.1 hypothetical protein [Deltaproteobacteria bacterium]